jgi:hypothetical protein
MAAKTGDGLTVAFKIIFAASMMTLDVRADYFRDVLNSSPRT